MLTRNEPKKQLHCFPKLNTCRAPPFKYLKGKCIIWDKSVVLYGMCQLPNSQIHSQYPLKRILQFAVKPWDSCPKPWGRPFCRRMTYFLSSPKHQCTGADWLLTLLFSYSCWEIHESWCCVRQIDVIKGLTEILVTKDHFIQFLIRTYSTDILFLHQSTGRLPVHGWTNIHGWRQKIRRTHQWPIKVLFKATFTFEVICVSMTRKLGGNRVCGRVLCPRCPCI